MPTAFSSSRSRSKTASKGGLPRIRPISTRVLPIRSRLAALLTLVMKMVETGELDKVVPARQAVLDIMHHAAALLGIAEPLSSRSVPPSWAQGEG